MTTPGEHEARAKEEENDVGLGPEEATNYRSIAARANYLAADRPDIMYSVKELCRRMDRPTKMHWHKLKRLWRYLSESGLERVVDATGAQEGEAYLTLTSGAETHQPNPASPGETVEITFWARGETDGDTLEVTLDFRDQEMWTTPLQTETEVFSLTTDWQSFSVSGTAPEGSRMLPVQ